MGLLNRLAAKRKQPPPSPAKLERARRQRWGDDLYERLCGEGNAFDGAQTVIARAKESGAWFDPDARKANRQRFKLNRKETKRRIARLERRINGTDVEANGSGAPAARSPSATKPSITQPERNQAMTTKTKQTAKKPRANVSINLNKVPEYKGHRAGTGAAFAHKFLDDNRKKKLERKDAAETIAKATGVVLCTAEAWVWKWINKKPGWA